MGRAAANDLVERPHLLQIAVHAVVGVGLIANRVDRPLHDLRMVVVGEILNRQAAGVRRA